MPAQTGNEHFNSQRFKVLDIRKPWLDLDILYGFGFPDKRICRPDLAVYDVSVPINTQHVIE